jgi:hypothetical protein
VVNDFVNIFAKNVGNMDSKCSYLCENKNNNISFFCKKISNIFPKMWSKLQKNRA